MVEVRLIIEDSFPLFWHLQKIVVGLLKSSYVDDSAQSNFSNSIHSMSDEQHFHQISKFILLFLIANHSRLYFDTNSEDIRYHGWSHFSQFYYWRMIESHAFNEMAFALTMFC
jgi:hypothetical protein